MSARGSGLSRVIALGVAASLLATLGLVSPASADRNRPSTSNSTFRLNLKKDRIDVRTTVTVTNRLPNKVTVGPCAGNTARTCRNTTRFFIASFAFFAVQTGARGLTFSGPGVKARADHKNGTYTNYIVEFAPIYQGQSRTFKARYHLPAAVPRSPNRTRVTAAYAHFCWHGQPTDRGKATAVLPRDFVPSTKSAPVKTKRTKKAVTQRARRTRDMGKFYACTDAFRPGLLLRTETTSPGGQVVTVEGWPEDPEWSAAISSGVRRTLPLLETIAGTPVPSDDIVLRQVASQALGGYAGDFDDKSGQIRVGERFDDRLLIAHELAHAWYNGSTVSEKWMIEGHAEWMARRATAQPCAQPGDYPGAGKPKLRDWRFLSGSATTQDEDVVDYQYAAACDIVETIYELVGIVRMQEITRALLERTPKYGGSTPAKPARPDWREWLDAVDELGVAPADVGAETTAQDLLVRYGIVQPRQLEGRAAARAGYHEKLDGSWGRYMPLAVRDLMDGWRFDKATRALDVSDQIMTLATEASSLAGEDLIAWIGPLMRDASSIEQLRRLRDQVASDPASFEAPDPADPPSG